MAFRFRRLDTKDRWQMERFLSMFTFYMDGLEGNLAEVTRRGPWRVEVEYDLAHRYYRMVIVHEVAQFYICQIVSEELVYECQNTMDAGRFPIQGNYPEPQERNYSVMELLEMANKKLDTQLEDMKK